MESSQSASEGDPESEDASASEPSENEEGEEPIESGASDEFDNSTWLSNKQ